MPSSAQHTASVQDGAGQQTEGTGEQPQQGDEQTEGTQGGMTQQQQQAVSAASTAQSQLQQMAIRNGIQSKWWF